MTLGEKILSIRKAKGLTQKELASTLSMSFQAIQAIEIGRNKELKQQFIAALVFKLGVNPYFILGDDPKEPMFAPDNKKLRSVLTKYEGLVEKLVKLKIGEG